MRGRYRWQLLLKAKDRGVLHQLIARFRAELTLPGVIRVAVDIDPVDML
ncbi:MAG TPA: hypothetical protein VFR01_09200 [Geobacterales bacterium]|nr:hypothetical protein [Geobacterales bacterium]